jgi:hypothetical protein
MNETSNSWLSASGTSTLNNSGITLSGTSINSLNYTSTPLTYQNMRPQQVKVAVFTITRDEDTNEINSTKFVKELWIERKNGTSIDLIVAKQLDENFDPETTVIKEITSISF